LLEKMNKKMLKIKRIYLMILRLHFLWISFILLYKIDFRHQILPELLEGISIDRKVSQDQWGLIEYLSRICEEIY